MGFDNSFEKLRCDFEKCESIDNFRLKDALFIDAMNTIFIPKYGRWELYKLLLEKYVGANLDVKNIEQVYKVIRKENEKAEQVRMGKHPKGFYKKHWGRINSQIVEYFCSDLENVQVVGEKIYDEVMGNSDYYTVQKDVVDFLENINKDGKKIYIVSNQETEYLYSLIDRFNLGELISGGVVSSDDVGYKKPDIRFFREAVKISSLKVNQIAFIGNNPRNDMEGAARVGINCRVLYDQMSEHVDTEGEVDYVKVVKLNELLK